MNVTLYRGETRHLDLGNYPSGVQLTYNELRDCRRGDPIAFFWKDEWFVSGVTPYEDNGWSDICITP